ncbi:MAG: 3-dehydroquinate synthase family protein, partial [Collinsella sp.]|nr:3-dehydroquinate synthase family protein [Collinsella sp.]
AEHELSRSDVIVALGGGVVGDVAGFVAATYMRGCKFVQIPTSLLAMVDSSVGGKTAIDLAAGKNLAGVFWQPNVVIADVGCLATLTPEQFADGCGEVVKHAVIADPELFAELEKTPLTLELLNRDVARVALIIARNIDIKRAVVVADEHETNQRKLLNFGHSAGHAVEACEHFELGHGNCVSIGMGIITRAAALHGICDAALPGRIEELCARHGLKTRCDLDADAVFAEALHDKKRAGDTIDLVIPHGIGRCSIDRTPLSTFHELIAEGLGQKGDASAC